MVNSVVVVLGAKLQNDGRLSPGLLRRVNTACELASKIKADLLMSGGDTNPLAGNSEAQSMKNKADKILTVQTKIFCEEASFNTLENAKYCSKIIKKHEWQDIYIVSDQSHLRRAKLSFEYYGIQGKYIPAEPLISFSLSRFIFELRELVALLWYKVRLSIAFHRFSNH